MSNPNHKVKHNSRLFSNKTAVAKQVRIAKVHGIEVKEPHTLIKHHVVNCGNPKCILCSNPRKLHKNKLTQQEKSFGQTEKWTNDGEIND